MKNFRPFFIMSVKESLSLVIILYQYTISPDHGFFRFFPRRSGCRFYPTCSDYALGALRQYGLGRGIMVSCKRIIRCHPWSEGGLDPVEL